MISGLLFVISYMHCGFRQWDILFCQSNTVSSVFGTFLLLFKPDMYQNGTMQMLAYILNLIIIYYYRY